MKKFKKTVAENWATAITALFVIVTLIYLVIMGDGIYLQVHDNLDSNTVYYKILKERSLYWSLGTKVPFLGGIDRNYLYSDLKLYTWLHMLFPNLTAIIIGWYLKIGMSILGFFQLGKTIFGGSKDRNIFIACGLIYGILPTFPTTPFGFASLPILMTVMLLLYRRFEWKYFFILLLYPVLSDFPLFGVFICGYVVVFFIIDWIVEKKAAWRFIIAVVAIVAGYVITEWRLFYIMLFSQEESLRTTMVTQYEGWFGAAKLFVKSFLIGHYHSGSSHTLIVLPACFVYFVSLNWKYIKDRTWKSILSDPFNWIMVWQGFNCVVYAVDSMEWFDALTGTLIPPLRGFSYARTLWFSPFLWYFAFMMLLCRISWKTIGKFMLCQIALIVVCLYPNTYNHIFYNCAMIGVYIIGKERFEQIKGNQLNMLSYKEFYSVDLFDKIKEEIGYNDEWSIAYGMHPAVINYNGIASLDGYLSYYSKDYKDQFRKLIAPDLDEDPEHADYFDSWGGRAYVYSKDVSYAPYRTLDVKEAELLIDLDVFRDMGGKFVFSRVAVSNVKALGMKEVGLFKDDSSPYTIYVYETK